MSQPSLLSFITNAGPLVKSVMTLLWLASLVSWTVIFRRMRFFRKINRGLRRFDLKFNNGKDIVRFYASLSERADRLFGIERIFYAGFKEFMLYRKQHHSVNMEQAALEADRAMEIALNRELIDAQCELPILATIGSVSPYVGLFGTVWGIMTSFRSLSGLQQASIAMVAPGISEALIATAIGLFAAIPAVIGFNRYTTALERTSEWYDIYRAEISKLLHQQRD